MRRCSALALTLLLSACASGVEQVPRPVAAAPVPVAGPLGQLTGKTSAELIGRFGSPVLRVQEGSSLKLQFRSPECVLDAYLYPSAGTLRVKHVDARYASGAAFNQAACIVALTDPNRTAPN
ncbi:MAG: hypothetical protein ABIO80_05925 [Sphingomicrobium sp.]